MTSHLAIKPATIDDVPLIPTFIKELAEYEKLSHEVVATEDGLRQAQPTLLNLIKLQRILI